MEYNSTENKTIKNLKKLHNKKCRDEQNKFLIEGEHLIKEAYKHGYLESIYLFNTNIDIDIEKNYINEPVAKYLTNLDSPSNMIGVCKKINKKEIKNKIVYLDEVQDPGNLGTIIRSCVAFNIDTLILKKCVDIYNPKVIRATQGLIFKLNIIIDDNNVLETLKDYKIYGTKLNNAKSLKTIEKTSKFVIIMGNEGKGISPNSEKYCNEFIYIPMNNDCESLNVGVATSIILYEMMV